MKKTKLITMTSCVAFVVSANAATVTVGSAPVVDGADQSNYATQANKHKFWSENSGAGLTRGQTFTTGSEDVVLNSFSFVVGDNTQAQATKTYNIRVGSVAEALGVSQFNVIADQDATQNDFWGTAASTGVVDDGETAAPWATFTFDSPVSLSANTEYAVDLGMSSSSGGWRGGIPYLSYSNSAVDGAMFSSGVTSTDPGTGDTSMNVDGNGRDMLFHLDMEVAGAVPEPSTTALLGLGGLALILRRRK